MVAVDDDPDRLTLQLLGFDDRALSYASPAQRFATRRERIQHDLALLVAYGPVTRTIRGHVLYRLTERGDAIASSFTVMYARTYTESASVVVARLRKLSDTRLRDSVVEWTRVSVGHAPAGFNLADLDNIDDGYPYPDLDLPAPLEGSDQ